MTRARALEIARNAIRGEFSIDSVADAVLSAVAEEIKWREESLDTGRNLFLAIGDSSMMQISLADFKLALRNRTTKERESCAKVAEEISGDWDDGGLVIPRMVAEKIRARGQEVKE